SSPEAQQSARGQGFQVRQHHVSLGAVPVVSASSEHRTRPSPIANLASAPRDRGIAARAAASRGLAVGGRDKQNMDVLRASQGRLPWPSEKRSLAGRPWRRSKGRKKDFIFSCCLHLPSIGSGIDKSGTGGWPHRGGRRSLRPFRRTTQRASQPPSTGITAPLT